MSGACRRAGELREIADRRGDRRPRRGAGRAAAPPPGRAGPRVRTTRSGRWTGTVAAACGPRATWRRSARRRAAEPRMRGRISRRSIWTFRRVMAALFAPASDRASHHGGLRLRQGAGRLLGVEAGFRAGGRRRVRPGAGPAGLGEPATTTEVGAGWRRSTRATRRPSRSRPARSSSSCTTRSPGPSSRPSPTTSAARSPRTHARCTSPTRPRSRSPRSDGGPFRPIGSGPDLELYRPRHESAGPAEAIDAPSQRRTPGTRWIGTFDRSRSGRLYGEVLQAPGRLATGRPAPGHGRPDVSTDAHVRGVFVAPRIGRERGDHRAPQHPDRPRHVRPRRGPHRAGHPLGRVGSAPRWWAWRSSTSRGFAPSSRWGRSAARPGVNPVYYVGYDNRMAEHRQKAERLLADFAERCERAGVAHEEVTGRRLAARGDRARGGVPRPHPAGVAVPLRLHRPGGRAGRRAAQAAC